MIVNTKEMLEQAFKNNYAVAQFNINNLEWTKYILEEAEKLAEESSEAEKVEKVAKKTTKSTKTTKTTKRKKRK